MDHNCVMIDSNSKRGYDVTRWRQMHIIFQLAQSAVAIGSGDDGRWVGAAGGTDGGSVELSVTVFTSDNLYKFCTDVSAAKPLTET